ncbi:MAG TPA: hypothetical protein VM900_05575 [Sphingomonas sp.]|nr:hypothetical protein [Sphingomonas sp.]
MNASSLRTGILIALLAGGTATVAQDQLDRYRTQLANGAASPGVADGAIAAAIAQWRALQQTDALPFDSYAGFVMAHPGWPGEAANRRAAERKAATASPGAVLAFFRRFPPQSATGMVAHARALQASGQTAEAIAAARAAWRTGTLAQTDESLVITSFMANLTPDDHDARMDALLWQGSTTTAARHLA